MIVQELRITVTASILIGENTKYRNKLVMNKTKIILNWLIGM
ncbi:hypothetical protein SAMN05216556_1399 [Aequorivita viscosa]|uniref:Uncharacterized protein n=1 Tax=Aequorivita viscosa TaxID=797419 RepID=A0A1M6P4A3_9FLAO|nr:hypothetical protein SAMN05216556_1399 [Aequorivita viscosa]SHK02761.1 hypothetical protein SAMN04487908_1429 [Aequorivita viscosa]